MKVFVLIIEHRHGQNMSVHKTREGAEANLEAYVQDYWEELSDHDQPDSQEERIALYFQDHPEDETYNIEEAEVLD